MISLQFKFLIATKLVILHILNTYVLFSVLFFLPVF